MNYHSSDIKCKNPFSTWLVLNTIVELLTSSNIEVRKEKFKLNTFRKYIVKN